MIKLQLFSKTWSWLNDGEPLELDANHVPRPGEVLDLAKAFEWRCNAFFVCDVRWVAENGKLVPYVRCREWGQLSSREAVNSDARREELDDHGWIDRFVS